MSDEHLKVIAELELRASGSPTIAALQAKIKALKAQIDKSFAPNAIADKIISPKVMKDLQGSGKALSGLTKKYTDMAKEARDLGQMNARVWEGMRKDIQKTQKLWQKSSGDQRKVYASDLREKIKYAQAYRMVYNREHQQYLRNVAAMHRAKTQLGVANWQQEERALRRSLSGQLRSHQNFMRSLRTMRNVAEDGRRVGIRAGVVGGAAVYGTAHAVGSAIRSARDFDRAEANARMNMDEREITGGFSGMRGRTLDSAVRLGQDPARYMQTIVEAAKAGVPESMSEMTGEMVTMLAKTFGVEVDQAMDGMGYGIAQEFGSGRLKSMKDIRQIGNIAAFLAGKTAARPDQMFSFLRTGMGSGAMLGLDRQTTLAFGASAIQAGAQGQQAATFLGSLGSDLAKLTMESDTISRKHHRSPQDNAFMALPGQLGYGGYADIESRIKRNPNTAIFDLISSFGKIKNPLDRKKAMTEMFGEHFARFMSNMIASPDMLKRTRELAAQAAAQTEDNDYISTAWKEYSQSLEFLMDRISATWKVMKTELGTVMKPYINELSQYVTDWYNAVKTGGFKEKFKAIIDGLIEGFTGKKGATLKDLLEQMFGKPGEGGGLGNTESYFKFARGFATGIREFVTSFVNTMTIVSKYFGENGDAEALGKLTAKILGFVASLVALSPVLTVFSSLIALVGLVASILGGPIAVAAFAGGSIGAWIAKKMFDLKDDGKGIPEPEGKKPGESQADHQKRIDDYSRRLLDQHKMNQMMMEGGLWHPTSYRSGDIGSKIDKLGDKIQYASFMSTDLSSRGRSGGLQYAYQGAGSSGGGSGGGAGGGMGRLLSGVGTPDALWKNVTPGGRLPNFGVGSGGIIKRDPSSAFGGGGGGGGGGQFSGPGMSVAKKAAMDQLRKEGVPEQHLNHAASLLMGQAISESGLNPNTVHDNGTGFGIYGARLGRRDRMFNWLAANGYAKNSLEGQMRYMAHEAMTDKTYTASRNALMGASDATMGSATSTLTKNFEAPKIDNSARRLRDSMTSLGTNLDGPSAAAGGGVGAGKIVKGVDPRLQEIVNAAATHLPEGYRVEMSSGFRGAGQANHNGNAADYKIIGPDGKAISNRGEDPTGMYTTLARHSYGEMLARYPNLKGKFAWGGAFGTQLGGGGQRDLMHFDVNGERGRYSQWQLRNMGSVPGTAYGNVPSPVDAVKNVPTAPAAIGGGMGGGGRSGGSATININGNSHDPEALANLVQRRVDESMNWRTHDSESEYT